MMRPRINPESPIFRALIVTLAYLYLFRFIGIYRDPGSVNEWLHLSQIGLTGGDHWGIYSQTYSLPTFARMIGVTTPEAWRTLVILLGLVGFTLFLFVAHRLSHRVTDFAIMVAILMFSPFARAAFNGQADYDGLTLISTAFFLISNHPVAAVLSGLLMGITNPEQSATTIVCVSLLWVVIDRSKLKKAGLALASLLIATATVRIILDDPDVTGRLAGYVEGGAFARLIDIDRLLKYFPHLFAGSWLLIILLYCAAWMKSPKQSLLLILTVTLLPSIALLATTDGSRVFALVAAPTVIVAATHFLPQVSRRALTICLLMTLLSQTLYLRQGWDNFEPRHPTMFENISSRPETLD